ncbi:MAG: ABC transporter permease [Alphaproteobacteria bacterium HGW-Alphaproteobacteria-4]|nr:MAG: ABC transporter permease [Alphaproteobacteria bacterium HGW-Alphaproteobacteria-4]
MRALDAKGLRDLRRIWAQALAIALVMACGVMVLVVMQGAERSLSETRGAYYERQRFADVFASLTRAPRAVLAEVAAIDGVAAVEGRIGFHVVLDLDGLVEPAMGRVISLPADGAPVLNVPILRAGRLPDPLRPDEVALSEPFAQANNLAPGASFRAIVGGRLRTLTVSGHVLSPEFVYTIGPGSIMPDDRRYGLIWMGEEAAAAARDMGGAFNELSLSLTRGASEPAVIAALDRLLAPYGGAGATGRDKQTSHAFLQNELTQLAAMEKVLPPIFLVISAFLVNMVLGRLIALERRQIGLLKAIGYSRLQIAGHYLKLGAGIGVIGVALGWGIGAWVGQLMTALYAEFFRFPFLLYEPGYSAFVISGFAGIATTLIGALRAVWASVRLSPAVAMSPPAPAMFRRGLADRLGGALRLRQTSMMILRSLTRWPGRALVTVFGVAASVAVLVTSYFTFDAMDVMMEDVFTHANRQQVTLVLAGAQGLGVLDDALALPGVLYAEGGFALPVRLRQGSESRLTVLEARPAQGELVRVIDSDGHPADLPPDGLVLPELLAADLGLAPGDLVTVELMVAPRETWRVPLAGTIRQSLGQGAYMAEAALFARLRRAPQVGQINLLVDETALPALYTQIKATPAVAGVMLWTEVRRQFEATMQQSLAMTGIVYTLIGVLITVGVVYNAARIQLSERAHELASLRVLGFSRGEVGFVLVGEIMVLTLAAVPLGWVAGYGFAAAAVKGLSNELVSLPLVVARSTYAMAAAAAVVTAFAAAMLVRRRLDRIDLVSALKAKE